MFCLLLPPVQAPQFFLQFITRYMHSSGQLRCRVTTLTRFWTDGNNSENLINGFDQVKPGHCNAMQRSVCLRCSGGAFCITVLCSAFAMQFSAGSANTEHLGVLLIIVLECCLLIAHVVICIVGAHR